LIVWRGGGRPDGGLSDALDLADEIDGGWEELGWRKIALMSMLGSSS